MTVIFFLGIRERKWPFMVLLKKQKTGFFLLRGKHFKNTKIHYNFNRLLPTGREKLTPIFYSKNFDILDFGLLSCLQKVLFFVIWDYLEDRGLLGRKARLPFCHTLVSSRYHTPRLFWFCLCIKIQSTIFSDTAVGNTVCCVLSLVFVVSTRNFACAIYSRPFTVGPAPRI